MSLTKFITGQLFSEIGDIGESANFKAFTQDEISSDGYMKIGLKSFEISASVVAAETTNNDGKVALMAAIEVEATNYLVTVLRDESYQYIANIYVLSSKRENKDDENATDSGNYIPKDDVFVVEVKFEIRVAFPFSLELLQVIATDGTETLYNLNLTVAGDVLDIVTKAIVTFGDYAGETNPVPSDEFIMINPVTNLEEKVFTLEMNFADPSSAVGVDYGLTVELRDSLDNPIDNGDFVETITVETP